MIAVILPLCYIHSMLFNNLSIIGIAAAVAANMVIGMLWYSPLRFGKQWMAVPHKLVNVLVMGGVLAMLR